MISDDQLNYLHRIADTTAAFPHRHTHEDVDLVEAVFTSGISADDYGLTLTRDQRDTVSKLLDLLDPAMRVDEPESDGEGSFEGW